VGTSSDFQGGQGSRWTAARRAATSFAKGGGDERARRLVGRYVRAQGGAQVAAAGAGAGIATAQRLGAFLANVAGAGLPEALDRAGLGDLVGASRFDVIDALAQSIAGSGGTLDDQAARAAALDVIELLFAEFADDDPVEELPLDAAGLIELIRLFICRFIYNRLRTQIDERLRRLPQGEREARDRDLQQTIAAMVELDTDTGTALALDWAGAAGRRLLESLIADVFTVMEESG
jgi:hypothetical protein